MFEVTLEKDADLLKVSYAGHVGAEEAKRCAEKIHLLVSQLQQGFRMLTDLRALDAMDLACVPYIENMMDWCDEAGIKTVVRVIPDSHKDIGLNIISLFHYRPGVRIVTCRTLEEAQAVLAR
jgi:hypothetical protein